MEGETRNSNQKEFLHYEKNELLPHCDGLPVRLPVHSRIRERGGAIPRPRMLVLRVDGVGLACCPCCGGEDVPGSVEVRQAMWITAG